MNDYARMRMDRARRGRGRDGRRMDYARRGGRDRRDYHGGEYSGSMEYRGDYRMGDDYDYDYDYEMDGRMDGRQGVRGTGRYGRGGSMYRGDRARGGRDYYDDGGYDYADEPMRLTKREMQEWKRRMQNADGSLGEHFSGEQIKNMAEKLGVRYNGYDEKELCMTVNMLYSDYCEAMRMIVPPDKELMTYVKLAKAWLEDEDAPEGGEKLALYFRCILDDEE